MVIPDSGHHSQKSKKSKRTLILAAHCISLSPVNCRGAGDRRFFYTRCYQGDSNMAKAQARHILVDKEEDCAALIEKIKAGEDFGDLARQHSKCPSGQRGGDLGEFGPGMMVPEFDKVVFSADVGVPQGPVKTDFGYHVVEVTSRTD